MLESYLIYFFICICLLLGAFADKQTKHISGWLSIIICSIILGYRYDVGIDHLTYLDYYNQFLYLGAKIGTSREYGYDLLNYICARIGCSPGVFFSLTVFIQFSLIYYSFRSKTNFLVLIYFFYMTTGQLFGSLNIIRQAMAFSIFLYIIKYIERRKLVKYLVGVLIAFSFHSSSLILIPIYWLPFVWRLTLEKIGAKGHVILYLGITLSSAFIFSYFLSATSEFLSTTVYFNYVPNLGERRMAVNSGLGILLFTIIDVLIIYYSTKIIALYPKAKLYYMIFFIGSLLAKVFGTDMLLSRVAYDLVSLRFVVLVFLICFFDSRKNLLFTTLKVGVIMIFILVWLFDIYNGSSGCSPYKFL